MKDYTLLFGVLFFVFFNTIQAQPGPYCGQEYVTGTEDFAAKKVQMDRQLKDWILADRASGVRTSDTIVYTIPVVWHVLHLGQTENIPIQRIYDEMDNLNEIFRNIGYYDSTRGVDVYLEFCLAQVDPDGLYTSGIEYIHTPFTEIDEAGGDFAMKQMFHWDTRQYLNVYSARILLGGGVAGYAYYPYAHGESYDGVVMLYSEVGRNKSSTSTLAHEVGHYLGLPHPFSGGCANDDCLMQGDQVCDTPPDASIYFEGCGPANHCTTDADDPSSNNPFQTDVDDYNDLYMDYNQSECARQFTAGQVERMRAVLRNLRPSLLNSHVCRIPDPYDAGITEVYQPQETSCAGDSSLSVVLRNFGIAPLTSVDIQWQIDQGPIQSYSWTGAPLLYRQNLQLDIPLSEPLPAGKHRLSVFTSNPSQQNDAFILNDSTVISIHIKDAFYLPLMEDFELGLPSEWTVINPEGLGWEVVPRGCAADSNQLDHCMYMDNQIAFASGFVDGLVSPLIDLTYVREATISFDYAYAMDPGLNGSGGDEELRLSYSLDCGNSFLSAPLFNRSGFDLATHFLNAADSQAVWQPECDQWRTIEIDLSAFEGQKIMFRFDYIKFQNGFPVYLDNIQVNGVDFTSVEENLDQGLTVYPNPSTGTVHVAFQQALAEDIHWELRDIQGRMIQQESIGSQTEMELDFKKISPGIYILLIQRGDLFHIEKLILE